MVLCRAFDGPPYLHFHIPHIIGGPEYALHNTYYCEKGKKRANYVKRKSSWQRHQQQAPFLLQIVCMKVIRSYAVINFQYNTHLNVEFIFWHAATCFARQWSRHIHQSEMGKNRRNISAWSKNHVNKSHDVITHDFHTNYN